MVEPASLAVLGLRKSFGPTTVLLGVDLEVPSGSLSAVLGPSGCGKTTLLRLVAGFERAEAGSIRLGGRIVEDERTHLAPERREIGFVPQEGALFPHLDVRANVGFGLPRSERRGGRVEELLTLLGLDGLGTRFPHQLSGGQQQRVALARALAPRPAVVLLDEPFDALDAGLRAQVRAEVRAALRASGATALLVTHDQEEALSLADHVALMRGGRIIQAADPETLYREPLDAEAAVFLGDAVLLEGRRVASGIAKTALGLLPLRGTAGSEGETITVMLRPEQLSLGVHGPDGEGVWGEVKASTFFGHDATAKVAIEGAVGLEVLVRASGHRLPPAGSRVAIGVEGNALAFDESAPSAVEAPAPAGSGR